MIVRIARVKVGNRQASYAVRPEPRFLQKDCLLYTSDGAD